MSNRENANIFLPRSFIEARYDTLPYRQLLGNGHAVSITELCTSFAFHTVTNWYNYIKIVIIYLISFTIRGSVSKFCPNWIFYQLFFFEYVSYMLSYNTYITPKQIWYFFNRKPNGLILQFYFIVSSGWYNLIFSQK